MSRRGAAPGTRFAGFSALLGALVAVLMSVAVVVAIGWFLDDAVQQWWWLIAAVGVGAGLVELLILARSGAVSTATTSSGTGGSSAVVQAFPDPATRFDPVAVPGGPRSGWGTDASSGPAAGPSSVTPMPSGLSSPADPRNSGAPTTIQGAPADGSGLDAPTLPTQPATATAVAARAAPAMVRRAATAVEAMWRSGALWTPKSSHEWADHEDAWAIDDTTGRAALADGASSAFMARQWAMAITSRFLDDPPQIGHGGFSRWVSRATEQWMAEAAEGEGSTSWWAGASERRGSYATLIGIALEPEESDEGIGFTAIAVGDSCLVHLTPDDKATPDGKATPDCKAWKRALAFPLDRPEDFGKHPELVATTGARSDGSVPVVRSASGQLRAGDAMLLLSDAVAQFALEIDSGGDCSIWSWLMTADQDEFSATIAKARAAEKIEDDDSTVLRILI